MLEMEMKFPVAEFQGIEKKLALLQARTEPAILEADHYFNAPDRDYRQTDEALRLRRIGPVNLLTYKGPKLPGQAKTRTEIEVPVQPGHAAADQAIRLLEHLRYRPSLVVRKQRQVFHLDRSGFALQVCLDDVEDLGRFIEIEIVAPPEQKERAEAVLANLAGELGLPAQERRSYLQMLLVKKGLEPQVS